MTSVKSSTGVVSAKIPSSVRPRASSPPTQQSVGTGATSAPTPHVPHGPDAFDAGEASKPEGLGGKAVHVAKVLLDGAQNAGDKRARAAADAVQAFLGELTKSTFGRALNGVGVPVADAEKFASRATAILGLGGSRDDVLFNENQGINAHNAATFGEDPILQQTFVQFVQDLRPADEAFKDAVAKSRAARGVTFAPAPGEKPDKAGRDFAMGDPGVTELLGQGALATHPADILIGAVRKTLPPSDANDPRAVLQECGKLLLLLHDDVSNNVMGTNHFMYSRLEGPWELLAHTPTGCSLAFSDWLEPFDVRPRPRAQQEAMRQRLADVAEGRLESGSVRHGRYHLNAATAFYILAAADLGFAFRQLCPQVQARMASEYKALSSETYSNASPVRAAVHAALKDAMPGLFPKARRGTLTHDQVIGDGRPQTDPFRKLLDDPKLRARVLAQVPDATPAQIEHALVHEQALLFHTVTTVDLHRGGKAAALRLQARIERAIAAEPKPGAAAAG